ncbi:hypothetical protein GCK32_003549, partial [Trichostrongylus colubriformis]
TPYEKLEDAFLNIGWPTMQGALSTCLAISPILIKPSNLGMVFLSYVSKVRSRTCFSAQCCLKSIYQARRIQEIEFLETVPEIIFHVFLVYPFDIVYILSPVFYTVSKKNSPFANCGIDVDISAYSLTCSTNVSSNVHLSTKVWSK